MFTSKHYIPILRWKEAEKGGLGQLRPDVKKNTTPLIELIMPRPRGEITLLKQKSPAELLTESIALFQENLPKVSDDILRYWGDGAVFIDFHLVDSSIRAEAMQKVLSHGEKLNIFMIPVVNIIPVIGFDSDLNMRKVAIDFAKQNKRGLCLRILRSDLNQELLSAQIKNLIQKNGLKEQDIDLIIDLQVVGEGDEPITISGLINQKIPDLKEWRTFTVAGGAFPPDLTQFANPNRYDIPRFDWTKWISTRNYLKRKPSFSDYTIQCPIYKEPVLDANPSASLRYTLRDKWIIMKGRALRPSGIKKKKSPGFSQYPAQARLLSNQPEFFGKDFSEGDSYITEKGKDLNTKATGNPMTWLRAGINHHLTCTADQVSSLS